MRDANDLGWKAFTIRLIEVLRWPAAWAIIVYLLREPLASLIHRLLGGPSG